MPEFLGIDTSNYTTSTAIFDSDRMTVVQAKRLLPVKNGALGLRQSDAVFHHTKQLPDMVEQLCAERGISDFAAIGASARPRNISGSYMPCFLCGEGFGRSYSALRKTPLYTTSHQVGHILAALYSADRLELVNERFIAFHVSGGTTDCLLCEPDESDILRITEVSTSLDLNAGQAVDRVGLMLGLKFPCGIELEKLAANADKHIRIKPALKNGSCCLSGVENKCRTMLDSGEKPENIAAYCLDFIGETVMAMTEYSLGKHGSVPLVFAGGVMSDKLIRDRITAKYPHSSFAAPKFSCDNAAGVAIYAWLKCRGDEKCR